MSEATGGKRHGAKLGGAALVLIVGAGLAVWTTRLGHREPPAPLVYSPSGLGGWVKPPAVKSAPAKDAVGTAVDAYNAGRYREAEALAGRVIRATSHSADASTRKGAVRARWVQAFSAARRKQFGLARERFALLRSEASRLPDGGKPEARIGEHPPTLEEEGAYEHAVLMGAQGDREGAEREFVAFMREYPESPLIHAAIQRIGRYHGGDVPKPAEAVWKAAMETALRRDRDRQRQASMCGPEVVGEVLRRRGLETKTRDDLAREMRTDERGTSMKSLSLALKRRGLKPRGLMLTWKGLQDQWRSLESGAQVIALVEPGHYVIIESVTPMGVRTWDPGAPGSRPQQRDYSQPEWGRAWRGVALVVGMKT